jgi:hypothetical protein
MRNRAFITLLCLVGFTLVIGACGPLPKPFKRSYDAPPNPLVTESINTGVWIDLMEGPSVPMAKLLTESVARELKNHEIEAYTGDRQPARYVLKAEAVRNENTPEIPYVVQIHWTLFDLLGSQVGIHSLGVPGSNWDWENGSPQIIRHVGEAAAGPLAALMRTGDEPPPAPQPERATGLWVQPISGAPGDGDTSLTRAIRLALRAAGTEVVEQRSAARFALEGIVQLSAPDNGAQQVKIDWIVRTSEGDDELGRASQINQVPAGTFDGPWGGIASLIAAAAMGGILDVMANDDIGELESKNRQFLRIDVPLSGPGMALPEPERAPDPRIPLIPGRAEPPPG